MLQFNERIVKSLQKYPIVFFSTHWNILQLTYNSGSKREKSNKAIMWYFLLRWLESVVRETGLPVKEFYPCFCTHAEKNSITHYYGYYYYFFVPQEGLCDSKPGYVGRENENSVDLNRDFPDQFDPVKAGKFDIY